MLTTFYTGILGTQESRDSSCPKAPVGNKKDGYRQQNVRQRQKLISIIDYDVCMIFY